MKGQRCRPRRTPLPAPHNHRPPVTQRAAGGAPGLGLGRGRGLGLQPGRLGQGEGGSATGRLLRENGGLREAGGTWRRDKAGYGPGISLKAGGGTAAWGATTAEAGTLEERLVTQAPSDWKLGAKA